MESGLLTPSAHLGAPWDDSHRCASPSARSAPCPTHSGKQTYKNPLGFRHQLKP